MDQDADEIRDAIAHTREEIADTIESLGHKADLKGRAHVKSAEIKASVGKAVGNLQQQLPERVRPATRGAIETVRTRPVPFLAGASAIVGLTSLVLRHRKRAA